VLQSVDELEADVERLAYRERLDTFLASRDAGKSLTYDALRAGITLHAVATSAKRTAEYTDEALAIIHEEYKPSIHCRSGCSYCCCKPNVLASIPELVSIVSFVEETFTAEARRDLEARTRRYRGQMQGRRVEDPTDESVPCPFLVDGRCSVYQVRPLICRGYNSTDVEACRRAHDDSSVLVPTFALLKDAAAGATVGTAQQLMAAGINDAMVDLGTALNLVFDAGNQLLDRIICGESDLGPAENRSWAGELWADVCRIAETVGVEISP
jgi:uncharacterized protein